MTDITEDGIMNFDIYYDEDGEPQEPYIFDIDRAHEAAGAGRVRMCCTCSKGARCMACMELDGLTKGVPA